MKNVFCSRCTESCSFTHIHISIDLWVIFHVGYYRVLCRPLLVFHRYFGMIYFLCISKCLLTPISYIYPFLTPFLWLNHKFVFSTWDCLSPWKYVHLYEFSDNISDILGHMSFAFWLTSRCVITSRLICGAAYAFLLFLFVTNIPFYHYTTSSLSIGMLWTFFCFYVLAITVLLQCTFACLCVSDSGGLRL